MSISLISTAHAAAAAAPAAQQHASAFSSILLLVGFVLIFYFLLWRPQSKRAKEQRELTSNLSVGDEVVTTGGMLGTITKLTDDFAVLKIADGIELTVQKQAIGMTYPKGTIKSI